MEHIESKKQQFPYRRNYRSFQGHTLPLFAWKGEKMVILSRNGNLDPSIMRRWLSTMDIAYQFYVNCTGRIPNIATAIDERSPIADVPNTCGAGCGYISAMGIEILNSYFDWNYSSILLRNEYDQTPFYELGRNFWFYNDQLRMVPFDIATGYAVFMRFKAMEAAGVKGAPFNNWTFDEFKSRVEGLIDIYLTDSTITWQNTLGINQGIPQSQLGATDLFASFLFRLSRDYGGEEFVNRLWKQVGSWPAATSATDALNIFALACSRANGNNILSQFYDWGWPITAEILRDPPRPPLPRPIEL